MDGRQCIYEIGGPSIVVALAEQVNSTIPIPVLDDGTTAHWIVCQRTGSGSTSARTGSAGEVMTAISQGIGFSRNSGDTILKVPRGHTNIHLFSAAAATAMVTPLAEEPGR